MPRVGRKGKRKRKRLPKFISDAKLKALLCARSRTSVLGRRARCLMALLGLQGLRVFEACGLTMENVYVDADIPYLRIIGKGDKERRVWIRRPALAIIEEWLEIRPLRSGDYLLPVIHQGQKGFGGKAKKGKPLSTNSARGIVRRATEKAGICHNITPHMLRHTFATQFLLAGGNLKALQDQLGHADLSTTAIYLQVLPRDIIKEIQKMDGGV